MLGLEAKALTPVWNSLVVTFTYPFLGARFGPRVSLTAVLAHPVPEVNRLRLRVAKGFTGGSTAYRHCV